MTTAQQKMLLGIYSCMCEGMTTKEIAEEMGVTPRTVTRYKKILKENSVTLVSLLKRK